MCRAVSGLPPFAACLRVTAVEVGRKGEPGGDLEGERIVPAPKPVMDDLARRRVAVIAGAATTRSLSPGSIDFADRAGIDDLDLQPEGVSRIAHLPQCGPGGCDIRRIDEHTNANGLGHQLTQERQHLRLRLAP